MFVLIGRNHERILIYLNQLGFTTNRCTGRALSIVNQSEFSPACVPIGEWKEIT